MTNFTPLVIIAIQGFMRAYKFYENCLFCIPNTLCHDIRHLTNFTTEWRLIELFSDLILLHYIIFSSSMLEIRCYEFYSREVWRVTGSNSSDSGSKSCEPKKVSKVFHWILTYLRMHGRFAADYLWKLKRKPHQNFEMR